MLIHGAGYGWWNFINYIDTLSKSYYVIIPTLDGHSEDSQTQYISTEYCAEQIIKYIGKSPAKKLQLLYGLSLGGQIALEMMSSKPDIAEKAVIDGSIFYPQPKLAKISKIIVKYCYNIMFTKTACKIQMFLLKFSRKRHCYILHFETSTNFNTHYLITLLYNTHLFVLHSLLVQCG